MGSLQQESSLYSRHLFFCFGIEIILILGLVKQGDLFGIRGFSSPNGMKIVAKDVMKQINSTISEIERGFQTLKDEIVIFFNLKEIKLMSDLFFFFEKLLEKLDSISEKICSVFDPAELCRNVHPDVKYREAAEEVIRELAPFMHHLNTNRVLYLASSKLSTSKSVFDFFPIPNLYSEIALRFCFLKDPFLKKEGIFLGC